MVAANGLSRRGFLRAAPAAPLAAPMAAKSLVDSMSVSAASDAGLSAYPTAFMDKAQAEQAWQADRLRRLKAILAGEVEDDTYPRADYSTQRLAHHYDSLRSVSNQARFSMHTAACERVEAEKRRKWYLEEIERMSKSLGLNRLLG